MAALTRKKVRRGHRSFSRGIALGRGIAATVLLGYSFAAIAQTSARPRIGLVLGGGGARGSAHIGVLQVLEQLHVPVDCVAGTSMGGLVAGAFASGLDSGQMSEKLSRIDWNDMFEDNPGRTELNYRDRRLAQSYYPGLEFGVKDGHLEAARGLIQGQKLKLFFNSLVGAGAGTRAIENLSMPLSIIATDIGTGERVVYRDGDLTAAMRASMSVPGLLAPIDYRGKRLVDGGLVDNLPIGEVRARCNADVVIAVNVGTPLIAPGEVNSILSISNQMIGILTAQNVQASLASLKPDDILISPELEGITASDFDKFPEAAARGRTAALGVQAQLKRYAVPEAEYVAWRSKIGGPLRTPPRIDEVQIAGLQRVNPEAVLRHVEIKPGDQLNTDKLDRDLQRIYGDGWYESVDYSLLTARERNILRITPTEKSWGPNYLRFGTQMQISEQESDIALRVAYHRRWLNSLGGEWLSGADIGQRARVFTEFYQPLEARQRFFVEPVLALRREFTDIYQDDDRVAQYRTIEKRAAAYLGANVGSVGQARIGFLFRRFDNAVETGAANLPSGKHVLGGWTADIDFDQLNRPFFPTEGWLAKVEYFSGNQIPYNKISINLRGAAKWQAYAFNGLLYYEDATKGNLPAFDSPALGGFLRLSGFSPRQIIGGRAQLATIRGERIIGKMPMGFAGDLRAGLSLETGKVDKRFTETGRDGWQPALSVYLGGETPVGPIYLGYGRVARGGPSSFYLYLGLVDL
jgi:NTE family protein